MAATIIPILGFPKQALVANVSDVVFAYVGPALNISWTGAGTSYKVAWRLRDDPNWTNVPEVAVPAVSITLAWNLGKLYEFKFITLTGGKETLPDIYGFIIPSGNTPPSSASVVRVGMSQAKVSWTGPAATNLVAWGEFGVALDDYDIVTTPLNEVTVGHIDPEKHYDFRLFETYNDEMLPYVGLLQI